MNRVEVKICGLTRRVDAEAAAASGADFGGVILAPGGRRSIVPTAAAELFDGLPLKRAGVFVDPSERELLQAADEATLDVVQLHGAEPPEFAARLRADGRWTVWKALRPRDAGEFLMEVGRYRDAVDGILLDGWSAEAAGGTGARFPWQEVASHRSKLGDSPQLIVAGGLSPANVAQAVAILRPHVVDVSSGVEEAPGVKSSEAISAFVAAARGAPMDPDSQK